VFGEPRVDNAFQNFRHKAQIGNRSVRAQVAGIKMRFLQPRTYKADLYRVGNLPCVIEALHITVMIGPMTSHISLSSQVGTGSRSHCLFGDFLIIAVTSVSVAGWKSLDGVSTDLGCIVGPAQLAVSDISDSGLIEDYRLV